MAVRERVREDRHRMHARGYHPVQIWVPDVRSEQFAHEADLQAAAVADANQRNGHQNFIEAVSVEQDRE
ncbi:MULTISPECIES: antitoxin MazE-like protein [Kocuria]|uniref:DUF3018 family protein n=1 Tax=Kocuria subflava TaxID=1736139 RepID=A0A846TJ11_9MICC|nr:MULTISPECIES: antitoxin MazE-like protein [Kocuria]NKE09138.1 DUF3018 family protein [Kocuria subflava]